MATVTSRINASLASLTDKYNSHYSPVWRAYENVGNFNVTTEWQDGFGDWYGGIGNGSFRFTSITIPQGSTILSAKLTFIDNSTGASRTLNYKIIGVAEDNTSAYTTSPIDDARTRTHTSASVDWDATFSPSIGTSRDTSDITTVIQEIINRVGWSSGNALALYVYDDGSTAGTNYDYKYYSSYSASAPILTIEYQETFSPSSSLSPSSSNSPSSSISSSISPSASISPSGSVSSSVSPSPKPPAFLGLKIAKKGVNVLTNSDLDKMIFDSDYPTLKYFMEGSLNTSNIAGTMTTTEKTVTVDHNLGYYPFFIAYVAPTSGAKYYPQSYVELGTVNTIIGAYVTTTQLVLYLRIENNSPTNTASANAYCEYKIYKNDLLI